MHRALQLASLGTGKTSPNPLVGCVIIFNDRIIGEGWHKEAGQPHAEVNAVKSVEDKSLLKESTVYVTLEPCSHFGRTPSCADLLVESKVKKVVVACLDPNPKVAGRGVERLRQANIEVEVGILEQEAKSLNKIFFHHIIHQKPFVTLKWAQTADGFIARENFDSKWISNELSRQQVHKLRAERDAIMVGKNTVQYDNPSLNCRFYPGESPIRLLLDHQLSLEGGDFKLLRDDHQTIIFNQNKSEKEGSLELIKIPSDESIEAILEECYQKNITSILVEGGSKTLKDFIKAGYWQEAFVYQSQQEFGNGIPAPSLKNEILKLTQEIRSREDQVNVIDYLSYYQQKKK